MKRLVTVLYILFASGIACAQSVPTPAELITAMHNRYADKWYRTLSFEQQSITHKPDGTTTTELWHESLLLPGRLRIVFGNPSEGNGMLFANDRLYVIRDGKLASDRDYLHPLLILGFDVYTQPVDVTLQQLKDLHFDLATMHEEDLEGRRMYVVGAKQGDLKSKQFWIDKDRLYFVRLLEPSEKQPDLIQDIRFDDYKQVIGGGWLAEHVEVFSDGKLVFEEKYSDIKINPDLKADLFDPKQFPRAAESGASTPKSPK